MKEKKDHHHTRSVKDLDLIQDINKVKDLKNDKKVREIENKNRIIRKIKIVDNSIRQNL